MLFKEIVDGRTHGRTHARTTDDGRRTLKDHKSSLSTLCSGELKMNIDIVMHCYVISFYEKVNFYIFLYITFELQIFIGNICIDRRLKMMSNPLINAGKHLMSNTACA